VYFVRKIASRRTRRKPLNRQIEAAEVSNITFYIGNDAEATRFPEASFDLVTTMYCFQHEVPERGRDAQSSKKQGDFWSLVVYVYTQ
jgi:hypothetical protein